MTTTSSPAVPAVQGRQPSTRIGNCIDAIEYTSGFVAALRDSLEVAAATYDSHLASRMYLCDYVERKLRKVMSDLEYIRGIIQPPQTIEI